MTRIFWSSTTVCNKLVIKYPVILARDPDRISDGIRCTCRTACTRVRTVLEFYNANNFSLLDTYYE
jgi:hypothetical protein